MPMTSPDPSTVHELFLHVRTIVSVMLGLAVGRLLSGTATLIEHPGQRKLWWVHLGWALWAMIFVISFWWWEFHLNQVQDWTILKYYFLFVYSGLHFVVCALLFPASLGEHSSYQDYFLSRRRWFFGLIIAMMILDLFDGLLKGSAYLVALGPAYPLHIASVVIAGTIGILSRRPSVHAGLVVFAIAEQLAWSVRAYDRLI